MTPATIASNSIQTLVRDRSSGNSATRSLSVRAEELLKEREIPLPVWVRAPKSGSEFFTGATRAKLYDWAAKGHIRSVSIRERGQIKGVRMFHLGSILAFIEKCELAAHAQSEATNDDDPNRKGA